MEAADGCPQTKWPLPVKKFGLLRLMTNNQCCSMVEEMCTIPFVHFQMEKDLLR